MYSKREILRRLTSVGTISISGCTQLLQEGNVDLYVVNWCQDVADVEISILSRSEKVAFETEYQISPNEDRKSKKVVGGGEYKVIVNLDGEYHFEYEFTMGSCKNQKLVVRIERCNLIEFEKKYC
ncbi:hypothetical protein [Halorussus lipolyticus]|uniref:hypothetical protein n=1 Tax=Halorussus lipolyticus TaxID=3034024 RepID=UPI0023E76E08|nr:hypothetical protein [Halorussus sp. DT80]